MRLSWSGIQRQLLLLLDVLLLAPPRILLELLLLFAHLLGVHGQRRGLRRQVLQQAHVVLGASVVIKWASAVIPTPQAII